LSDRYFTLLAMDRGRPEPRLGVAVAKRHTRTGVERNRIKRQIRESFRLRQHRLPKADIVLIARRNAVGQPGEVLRRSLERLWARLARSLPPAKGS
jgi:ribonuclease P protein component